MSRLFGRIKMLLLMALYPVSQTLTHSGLLPFNEYDYYLE